MSISNPTYLWGLLAIIVPLAIHLLSKRKRQQLFWGSIQLLSENETSSARSIQWSEWPLFLLRVAIICGTLLLLAGWLKPTTRGDLSVWIEKDVLEDPNYDQWFQSMQDVSEWLPYEIDSRNESTTNHFRSLRALVQEVALSYDSVIIYRRFNPEDLRYFDSYIPGNINLRWLPDRSAFWETTHTSNGKTHKWSLDSEQFNWRTETTLAKNPEDTLYISMYFSSSSQPEAQNLREVLISLSKLLSIHIQEGGRTEMSIAVDTSSPECHMFHWDWKLTNQSFQIEKITDRLYQSTGQLNREDIIDDQIAIKLANVLLDVQFWKGEQVFTPPDLQRWTKENVKESKAAMVEARELDWLWLLCIVVLLMERLVSYKSQGS